MKPIISIIVALANNRAIGLNGDLVWHNSADMKRFKSLTTNHTVLMGRNTYLSLPNQKALPNRRNIILSSRMTQAPEGFELAHNIKEVQKMIKDENEVFVMGGGMIYEQFLPLADRLYLTKVNKTLDADTFFPFVNYDEWNLIDLLVVDDDPKSDCEYRFETWERKNL